MLFSLAVVNEGKDVLGKENLQSSAHSSLSGEEINYVNPGQK